MALTVTASDAEARHSAYSSHRHDCEPLYRLFGVRLGDRQADLCGRDHLTAAQLTLRVKPLRGIKQHTNPDHRLLGCAKLQRRKVDPGAAFPYQAILDRAFQS